MFEADYRFLSSLANFFVVYRFNSNPLCRLRPSSDDCDVLAYARVAIELKSALGNSSRVVLAVSFNPNSGEPYSVRPSSAQAYVDTKHIAECAQQL